MHSDYKAVVIGVSAGGFQALHAILSALPRDFSVPVIIVQHRMTGGGDFLVESLNRCCKLPVKEADDKESIQPGGVYLAPADYHLLVETNLSLSLSVDQPVCYARPSIDVLFETASRVFKSQLVGIILTGANDDGSHGLGVIKNAGGLTIAQDPATAEAKVMPRAAISARAADFVLPIEEIPPFLISLLEDYNENPSN